MTKLDLNMTFLCRKPFPKRFDLAQNNKAHSKINFFTKFF